MTKVDSFFDNVREHLARVDCTVETHDYPGGKVYVVEVGGVPTYRVNVPDGEVERVAASLRCSFVQVRFMSAKESLRNLLIKTLFLEGHQTSTDLRDSRFRLDDPLLFLSRISLSARVSDDGEVILTGVCSNTFGLSRFEEELISEYWSVICEKLTKYFPLSPTAGTDKTVRYPTRELSVRYPNVMRLLSHVFPDLVEKYPGLNFQPTETRSILSGKAVAGLGDVISREIEVMDYLSSQWELLRVMHLDPECAAQVRLLEEGRILTSSFQNFISTRGHDPDVLDRLDNEAPPCFDSMGEPKTLPSNPQVDTLLLLDGIPLLIKSTSTPKSPGRSEHKQYEDLASLQGSNGWVSKSIPHAFRTMMASRQNLNGCEEVMRSYRELLSEAATRVGNRA